MSNKYLSFLMILSSLNYSNVMLHNKTTLSGLLSYFKKGKKQRKLLPRSVHSLPVNASFMVPSPTALPLPGSALRHRLHTHAGRSKEERIAQHRFKFYSHLFQFSIWNHQMCTGLRNRGIHQMRQIPQVLMTNSI